MTFMHKMLWNAKLIEHDIEIITQLSDQSQGSCVPNLKWRDIFFRPMNKMIDNIQLQLESDSRWIECMLFCNIDLPHAKHKESMLYKLMSLLIGRWMVATTAKHIEFAIAKEFGIFDFNTFFYCINLLSMLNSRWLLNSVKPKKSSILTE